MNIDPANGASASSSASKASAAIPKRINVAVNAEMVAALDNVIQHEGVTLTEACRRLIGYGDFIYRMAKQERRLPSWYAPPREPRSSSSSDTQATRSSKHANRRAEACR